MLDPLTKGTFLMCATKLILANAIYRIIAKKAICFDDKLFDEY